MVAADFILFGLSLLLVIFSGYILVKTLKVIAGFLRLSEFVVSFIIMAFATSLPELFIGISSAIQGIPELSLGNIVGSNIANLTLIVGIAAILGRGIRAETKSISRDAYWMAVMALLPIILMIIGKSLSRIDGIILIICFLIYTVKLYKEQKLFSKDVENKAKRTTIILSTAGFIFALYLMVQGANLATHYARNLAIDLKVSNLFIGLIIIAFGTTLPELIFSIISVKNKHEQMALGNVIGSVIFNSTFIIGIASIITPITANFLLFITSGIFMIAICVLFATFLHSDLNLSWQEGISLLLFYVVFLIIEIYVKGIIP